MCPSLSNSQLTYNYLQILFRGRNLFLIKWSYPPRINCHLLCYFKASCIQLETKIRLKQLSYSLIKIITVLGLLYRNTMHLVRRRDDEPDYSRPATFRLFFFQKRWRKLAAASPWICIKRQSLISLGGN